MANEEIKKEAENYNSIKLLSSYRGTSMIYLIIIFLFAFWNRSLLAVLILPLIYYIKKGNKIAMIIAGVYSGLLTIVSMAVYIENLRHTQEGITNSSLAPVALFLATYVFAIIFLIKAYKVEMLRKK